MISRTNIIIVCAGFGLILAAFTTPAQANLLIDFGYEANPLTTDANVLGNFPGFQGVWGVEAATITGVDGGVTPPEGVKMLRMVDDGLVATQGFQVTDVTSYSALIDSGAATVGLSALLDVDTNVPAAVGGVSVLFFNASNFGSQIGTPITGNITLDALPGTWETASISGTIPVGTRWLLSQVAYGNASLIGSDGALHPGYVDAADLRIVPEPVSIGLLALGGLFAFNRRRF